MGKDLLSEKLFTLVLSAQKYGNFFAKDIIHEKNLWFLIYTHCKDFRNEMLCDLALKMSFYFQLMCDENIKVNKVVIIICHNWI